MWLFLIGKAAYRGARDCSAIASPRGWYEAFHIYTDRPTERDSSEQSWAEDLCRAGDAPAVRVVRREGGLG